MAVALLMAVPAIPSIQQLIAQVKLVVRGRDNGTARQAHRALQNALRREPRLVAVDMALRATAQGESEFAHLEELDPDNGLYAYLRLMPDLERTASGSPEDRSMADAQLDAQLAARIRNLVTGRPARLYVGRWRALAMEAHLAVRVPDRLAAYEADGVVRSYGLVYRPVLRELADGMLARAKAWREAGRSADAVRANAAVIRLMMNLVDDSPWPEVVLLAAEYIPAALRAITDGAGAAGLPPEVVEQNLAAAARLEALRAAWQTYGVDEITNLLPHTGDVPPAREAHDRVLRSMLAAGYGAGAWLALAVICMVLLPFARVAWYSGIVVRWRWGGWGRLVAVGIVIAPLLLAIVIFLGGNLSLAWLFSLPSVRGLVMPVLLTPVLVGVAAWLCVELPAGAAAARLSRRTVWFMAGAALVVLVGAAIFPTLPEAWRPSPGVQLFRRLGVVVGVESLALMLIWMTWGLIRRRRLKIAPGPTAAGCLAVAAWAWMAAAVVALAVSQLNSWNDARHEKAFVAASADPLADRLGPDWRNAYFRETEALLGHLDKRDPMANLH
ncbi:MAG TPA: hypothetical protein PLS82_08365 [Phycisphaerae bacterium]|nr:hypothetical protein [Phycisphaerae bacterium]